MKGIKALVLLMVSLSLLATEKAKKPFTLDALYRIKYVGNLALSPDGHYLAFRLTRNFLKKGKSNSDIYLLDLKTNKTIRITYAPKADYSPMWASPQCLYFISTRKEGPQIWKFCLGKGEPRQITHFPTGISSALPFRDRLFFTSKVYPECMADAKCNAEMKKRLEKGPVQAHLATSLLFRHWDHYRDFAYSHIFVLEPDGKIKALTKGKHDFPPFSLDHHMGMDISPDGKWLVYEAKLDPSPALSTNFDLYLLNLRTGKSRCLTCANRAWDGHPKFSPDGRYIGFIMQKTPGYESDRFRLAIYDTKRDEVKILTENYDNWVDDFVWSPDSKYIYFKAEERAHFPIYSVNVETGRIRKLLDAKAIREFVITPDGASLLLTRTSVNEPVEIWKYTIGGKLERLTYFNKKIEEEYDIRPAEEHWVKGADGAPIHVFIIKPHDFNPKKKYPLILNIHGGPQQMWADSFRGDWQIYPGAGYIVAFANPHGSPGYGQKFVRAISGDWGGKVMKDLMKVTDYLTSLPYVDENRMGAMGWSWGGYAIMWLEGHTTRFKALAAMMGVYNLRAMFSSTEELWFPLWEMRGTPWENPELYRKFSSSNYVKNFKTPCLIITGEKDYRVPYTQSIQFFTDLQLMGVPSMLIIFKNDGHWPNYVKSMPVYYNAHLEWFHKWLAGAPAPYSTEKLIRNLQFK